MGQLVNVPGGNYAKFLDAYFAGQILDARYTSKESFNNIDSNTLGFGTGIVIGIAAAFAKMARAPRTNQNTLTASTDLGSGNISTITVNGNATAPITFITSHAATMALLVTAIKALAGVTNCSYTGDILTITTGDADITVSGSTSGGSSVTWSAGTAANVDTPKGITVYIPKMGTLPTPSTASVGIAYAYQDSMTVLKRGVIAAVLDPNVAASAIVPDTNAYIVTAVGASRGTITNVSTGNLLIGKFRLDLDPNNYYLTAVDRAIPVEVQL